MLSTNAVDCVSPDKKGDEKKLRYKSSWTCAEGHLLLKSTKQQNDKPSGGGGTVCQQQSCFFSYPSCNQPIWWRHLACSMLAKSPHA